VGFLIPNVQRVVPSGVNAGHEGLEAPANMIDISSLPASVVELLRQLLGSMARKKKGLEEAHAGKSGKAKELESVKVVEKNAEMVESLGQGEARAMKGNIKPYCHRCLAKGHVKEECAVVLVCDICSSQSHLKHRCPLQKKASKIFAMTSGYVVDGLGFYYIPHQSSSSRLRGDHNGAVIRVLEGFLLGDQVALEMDRLVLGPTK
jgi:hypothetical protein